MLSYLAWLRTRYSPHRESDAEEREKEGIEKKRRRKKVGEDEWLRRTMRSKRSALSKTHGRGIEYTMS
jgi:hypothetical protein